ncbi:HD-GYP domain, c-di-GMP phosphodiesterase class II (or its inactivated variant) [Gracilibacillus ureilyticus]|uniref:HD-GYP domain, c-di-GMP phosphodiesterase class II (Or its inactivated variant) n=2 Tax=Gracilibacillus ureilyticus TaxID=531814 RepID=A0A1H9UZQ1_9BACI|nr:HD-GYP domain, c-di-GMP phosphodiesterase class II (or its inactivated variant) [Gracilibacillus ureilyticus]
MQVHPNQLVPGCIVMKAVAGKTQHPIVLNNTVIEEKHIEVLQHFNVKAIEVSERLVSGAIFKPKDREQEKEETETKPADFASMYRAAVQLYKKMFNQWQSGSPINLIELRKMLVPLFECIEDIQLDVFLLHKHASKEDYFFHHGISVAILSAHLAKKVGYHKEWIQVGLAGILADSGMARLDSSILQKEGSLTLAEYEVIKKHPTLSYRLVEHINALSKEVKLSILQHHERLDGSGYPLGVKEGKIHPFAKILAISDTYHAMTSERYYKKKQSPFKVIEEMLVLAHTKFDYVLLQTFAQTLLNYSIGTNVVLSDGREAVIVYVKPETPIRPIVRLIEDDEIISLKDKPALFIEKIISA